MANLAIMPRLSLNADTNLLSTWYVSEGEEVSVGDKLFSIETDKSTMDVVSDFAGVVLKRYCAEYEVVDVLAPVCAIGAAGEEAPALAGNLAGTEANGDSPVAPPASTAAVAPAPAAPPASAPAPAASGGGADAAPDARFASPRARALAREHGITSFAGIPFSGAQNRILEEDVLGFLAGGGKRRRGMESRREKKFSRIRQTIARNMHRSLQGSAQLTLTAAFNATALLNARGEFKRRADAWQGVTIGDLIVYGTARALREFPNINAWVGEDAVTEFDIVNIGVAVDTERGLMVPTIFDAGEMPLLEISAQTRELAAQCHAGTLHPDKQQNATFTVSNLGAFNILTFTPVLNPPQAAILGVGSIDYAIRKGPEGMLVYPACHLSLTFDHRALDGAPAARFLKKLCETLEHIDGQF